MKKILIKYDNYDSDISYEVNLKLFEKSFKIDTSDIENKTSISNCLFNEIFMNFNINISVLD